MYLIAKLFEQITTRLVAKAGKKLDVQFFNGTLPEVTSRQAVGNFTVFVDFPDLSYNSSGAGYGGQMVNIELNLMVVIRNQDDVLQHLKHLDNIVRSLHAWKPEGEFTPLMRISAGVDRRFDYPRVYSIGFKLTGTDRNSEAFEWSQTNDTEETAVTLNVDPEVVESLE
jgi:hypothetical protein